MEWLNAALSDETEAPENGNLPTLVVSQEHDDFSPALAHSPTKQSTLTLTANKMTRAQLSSMDLASFSSKFGTLTLSGKSRNGLGGLGQMKMLREESGFGLAEVARGGEDEEF